MGVATLALLAIGAVGVFACDDGSAKTPPEPPTDLMVTAASRAAISLQWTASATPEVTAYRVERTPVGAATFEPVADVSGGATTSYSDTTVDPYVAYTYRVRAVVGGELVSEPSNEDTAGPPPAELQLAVAAPTDQGQVYQYGVHTSLALDENDDPAIAYVGEFSTNSSGDTAKLYFVRWNRTDYRWEPPLIVDDELGGLSPDHPDRAVSLARDISNGRYGIAYTVRYDEVWLALSEDGGLTWAKEHIDLDGESSEAETSNPTLAMASDEIHVAYWHWCIKAAVEGYGCASGNDSHAVVYLHRTGASGSFTSELSPSLPQTQDAKPWLDMALDENGEPGIAYFLGAIDSLGAPEWYNVTLAFWRPGQAASFVIDSLNQQNDTSSVSLAFLGTSPLVAYFLAREEQPANDLWFSQSGDGSTWDAPLPLPRDGTDQTWWYQSLAMDSAGHAAIAAYFTSSGGEVQLGGPKLLRSSDLTSWAVSSPDAEMLPGFAGAYVDTAFAGNDKLNMVFFYGAGDSSLGDGVVFWREPLQ